MHSFQRLIPGLLLTVGLLSACSQSQISGNANLPGHSAPRYDYVVSVPLEAGDTRASVEAQLGGSVITWPDTDCSASSDPSCMALLGFNRSPAAMKTLSTTASRPVFIERNKDVFSGGGLLTATMGGARSLWASGDIQAWSGGARSLWASGVFSLLPQNTSLWTKINLQAAQALAPNLGAGVTVAVIDTGLDLNHSAFQGALSDPSTWYDFYAGDALPQDEGILGVGGFGHGTNVAGIVLQIAPKAKIMPLRVLGPDGSGDVATIAQAILWAAAKGANVINLSLGSTENSKVVQDAITKVKAQNVLVVSSAGNANANTITYPAALAADGATGDFSLSVGSVDLNDRKSSFSNYSDKLEVVGPGENVYAPAPGELMAAWSGTSMAAPMASGALALALAQPLNVAIKDLDNKLVDNAADVYANNLNQAYNGKLGKKGRLDLVAFLKATLK